MHTNSIELDKRGLGNPGLFLSVLKIYKSRISFFIFLIISLCFFYSCTTISLSEKTDFSTQYLPSSEDVSISSQEQISPSILFTTYENKNFPLIYHITTITMSENIKITASPKAIYSNGQVKTETTKNFSQRTQATVSINSILFDASPLSLALPFSTKTSPIGIIQINKTLLSEPIDKYSAIGFSNTNEPFLLVSQTQELPPNTNLVIGGFFTILYNSELYGNYKDIFDSRTAIGISQDKKTIYILTVEGKKKRTSKGLSYKACGEILKEIGAWDAIQLDGGGSTSLYIKGNNMLSYSSNRHIPFHLGFSEIIDESL